MRTTGDEWIPMAGRWWRFSRYERDGFYIRPAPGAELQTYDPWELYRAGRIRGDQSDPPYADFVNLGKGIASEGLRQPDEETDEHILAWCSRYGLPGVLLHQVRMVTLAPRWVASGEGGAVLVPGQQQFIRAGTGWIAKRSVFRPTTLEHSIDRPDLAGELVPESEAPEAWRRLGVLRHKLESADVVREGLAETWWRFFPDVPENDAETFEYPPPLTEAFWRGYAEPYNVFLEAMKRLTYALSDLEHHQAADQMSPSDAEHVSSGLTQLQALLEPATVTIVPEPDGKFAQKWICGSLLSSLAMMALQDLTESRRVRKCDSCQRLFVSQHPRALYCSESCRWKSQKRRQRERSSTRQKARRRAPGKERRR